MWFVKSFPGLKVFFFLTLDLVASIENLTAAVIGLEQKSILFGSCFQFKVLLASVIVR